MQQIVDALEGMSSVDSGSQFLKLDKLQMGLHMFAARNADSKQFGKYLLPGYVLWPAELPSCIRHLSWLIFPTVIQIGEYVILQILLKDLGCNIRIKQ